MCLDPVSSRLTQSWLHFPVGKGRVDGHTQTARIFAAHPLLPFLQVDCLVIDDHPGCALYVVVRVCDTSGWWCRQRSRDTGIQETGGATEEPASETAPVTPEPVATQPVPSALEGSETQPPVGDTPTGPTAGDTSSDAANVDTPTEVTAEDVEMTDAPQVDAERLAPVALTILLLGAHCPICITYGRSQPMPVCVRSRLCTSFRFAFPFLRADPDLIGTSQSRRQVRQWQKQRR